MAKKKPLYPCTIPEEMFTEWKKNYRHGDVNKIIEVSGFSKPTVSKAVKYGNASNVDLIQHINQFFKLRLAAELKTASTLKAAGQKNKQNGK